MDLGWTESELGIATEITVITSREKQVRRDS